MVRITGSAKPSAGLVHLGAIQKKVAQGAPPVYRPQQDIPRARPGSSAASASRPQSSAMQGKMVSGPPPVYRPQQNVPRGIAGSSAVSAYQPQSSAVQGKIVSGAPPVYRPQQSPLQAKAIRPMGVPAQKISAHAGFSSVATSHAPLQRAVPPPTYAQARTVQPFRLAGRIEDFGAPQTPGLTTNTRNAVLKAAQLEGTAVMMGGDGTDMGGTYELHCHCFYCQQRKFAKVRQWHPQEMTAIDHIRPSSDFLKQGRYTSGHLPKIDELRRVDASITDAGEFITLDSASAEELRRYKQLIYNDLDNLHIVCTGHNANKGAQLDFHQHAQQGNISFHMVTADIAMSGDNKSYKALHKPGGSSAPQITGSSQPAPSLGWQQPQQQPSYAQIGWPQQQATPSYPPPTNPGSQPQQQQQMSSSAMVPWQQHQQQLQQQQQQQQQQQPPSQWKFVAYNPSGQ